MAQPSPIQSWNRTFPCVVSAAKSGAESLMRSDMANSSLKVLVEGGTRSIMLERAHGNALTYGDSTATSEKPQAVLDALRNSYENNNANLHRGLHELSSRATEAYEASREHVPKSTGAATADEIIFTRGTTA